ncbi:hypothetical protein DOTSEDRAFT_161978 [Dothistroma septosporum NZE10]|uniref:Uncharacterized protein n=1 Tax=Dothistroma septosporum (strain NZE10 / CBS 128990) TaxID=675120 RepID=N1Q1D2_DOTSN|nr:hypothetical protein DOTSEDRAFT_161978 [Dothistroma septosporum NZE10]
MTTSPAVGDVEKQDVALNKKTGSGPHPHVSNPLHGHHLKGHIRERLRHFLHPNGKRVHVAASPEEAATLRQRLAQIHSDDEFDIYISGTPEHLEALRAAQNHHEDARDKLRQEHPDFFDRFDKVHRELDSLALELDRVTTHGVSLDAHFNRFGYNAHVRSYEDDSPGQSGANTPGSSLSGSTSYERGFARPLKLFKAPTLRQYFHKGILWRASGSEEVQSFELFIDLLYVGILQVIGDHASENPTGLNLLYFVITFTLAWKIWNDNTLLVSWFETDDVLQRVSILFLIVCLFGYTTNTTEAFLDTYATLIGFYLAARFFMACYLMMVAYFIKMVRAVTVYHVVVTLIGGALWIGSIHTDWPGQLALIFIALFVDIVGPIGVILLGMASNEVGGGMKSWYERAFEFIPAINIEHRVERTNAFVSLVFGFSVVALLYQSAHDGVDAYFGKAIMGLIQIFCFNWIYFEIDSSNLSMHAIRRHKFSALIWTFAHLPFILSFVLGGGGLAKLVIAYDTKSSHLEWLAERYQATAEEQHLDHIPDGLRWYYCGGFGIALSCMALVSMSHVHREHEGIRLLKKKRLLIRILVAIILICLPLAKHLNSIDLVGTVTGLIVFLLVTELGATSDAKASLVGREKACRYTGRCSRGQLLEMMKNGRDIDPAELAPKDKEKYEGQTVQP